jgi:broad specificity phosphatase PhoE
MFLYCVRHGETHHNFAGRIQGQSDSQLTPLGRRQCHAVAEALSRFEIDAVVASPLARARESAQTIAERLGLEVQLEPRLMEIHAGIFQERRWEDIEQEFPAEWALWRSQDPDYRIPGGESRRDIMLRTAEAFEAIREAGYHRAIVVAHGGSLSAAFKSLLGIPPQRNPFSLANASISTVEWAKDFKLLSLNDIGHLRDDASSGGDL